MMILFKIWHAYVNLSPAAYLEWLHMFIYQLGREIWTKMCGVHTLFWDTLYGFISEKIIARAI